MAVVLGCITPHPPILVPEIGLNELIKVETSRRGMETLSEEIAQANPDTCVIISPHSPAFSDAIAARTDPVLEGSLAQFGAPEVRFSFKNDLELAKEIISGARKEEIPVTECPEKAREASELDHGVLVPLYYLRLKRDVSLVSLSISFLNYLTHYQLGAVIREAAERVNRKVVFVASGDLSHRLFPGAPAGYSPKGKIFDLKVKDLIAKGAFSDLISLDENLIEEAGECGLRSIITLGGVFDGYEVNSRVLSYEGPFGVGYLVGLVKPLDKGGRRDYLRSLSIPPLKLAKEAIENYVLAGKKIKPPKNPPPCLKIQAGAFVSLKKDGALRGCIGTIKPTEASAGHEIIKNAINSALEDYRFAPIHHSELAKLDYSVDILGEPEEVTDPSHLDPKRYGVIVVSGAKTALLLPDLEGVDSIEEQLAIAKEKAGISEAEPVKMYRFKVQRYH